MDCTVEIDRLLVIDGSVDGRIDSGSTDPGAAVTRPDSDMTAGLHTLLAGCTLAFKSCDTGFFELCQSLDDTRNARMIGSLRHCLAGLG